MLLRHTVTSDAVECQGLANVDVKYSLRGILKNATIEKHGVIGW